MIISDLNHIEAVKDENTEVQGGFLIPYAIPFAMATALSDATAIGGQTATTTVTITEGVAGLFSHSQSQAQSVAYF